LATLVDPDLTLDLLRQLIRIPSVNPSLVSGAEGEGRLAHMLEDFLRRRGLPAELEEAAPGRANVILRLGQGKPELMVLAHLDTVSGEAMEDPFTPREQGGKIFGRGALDIKSGVAAAFSAAIALAGGFSQGSCLFAGVVDEEFESLGTQKLIEHRRADAAIVLEPTQLRVALAHKGFAWFRIETEGRAAHGSMPEEGRDAIRMMGKILVELDRLDGELAGRAPHRWLGRPSLHASVIQGGVELSSYPAHCRLEVERRTLPGESRARVETELQEAIRRTGDAPPGRGQMTVWRAPYEIAADHAIVRAVGEACSAVLGRNKLSGVPFWTDTAILAERGIPGVVFGPAGANMHGAEEYVEAGSVIECAEILVRTIRQFCSS